MTALRYSSGDRTFTGYLADGSNGAPAPGVLVIHEAGGLGDHARRKADMLAAHGYVALAADLFGEPVTSTEQAMGWVRSLSEDWPELRARGAAALAALCRHDTVDAARTAAIGFCFGGTAALELGRSGADLAAIVGFHSGLSTRRPEDSNAIRGKVLVALGAADPLIPREARDGFLDSMTASGVDCQMLLFTGVGHSFTNPDADSYGMAGVRYDAAADARSWAAMLQLFAEVFPK